MAENIWQYGEYDLDKDTLFAYLQSNLDSYLNHYDYSDEERQLFGDTLSSIKQTIIDDTLSNNDGFGSFIDNSGTLKDTEITRNALHYLHKVASGYGTKVGVRKKVTPKIDEKEPELYNSSKHGLNRYIILLINPGLLQMLLSEEDAYKAIQNNLSFWRSSYESDKDAIKGYSDMLDSYIQREDLKGLNYSNYGGTYNDHILDVIKLKNALSDGVLNKSDLRLFNKLGLSGHTSLFGLDNTKPINKEEELDTSNTAEVVLQADGSYETAPKDNTNNFNATDFWSSLDTNDKIRLGLILPELSSAISALIPGWGTAVSAATGVGTTVANLVNDLTDDDLSTWEAFKGFLFSGTMDLVGLLPGAGVTGKASKLSKILKPVAYTISSAMGVYGLNEAKESFDKIMEDPKSVEALDIQNLAAGIQALAGLSSAIGTKRAVNRHTTGEKMASVKTKSGKKADITETQLDELKKIEGYEGLNKKFKEWTGEELPYEFKPVNITWNPKKIRVVPQGPKTSKYTNKTLIDSEDRDAKLLKALNDEKPAKKSSEAEEPQVDNSKVEEKTEVKTEEVKAETKGDSKAETQKEEVKETPKTEVAAETSEQISGKKATEIKPDNQSKAKDAADITSKVSKPTTLGIKKRLKSFYRGKFDELDEIDKSIKTVEARIKEAGLHGRDKANQVAKKGGGSREYEVLLRRLILSGESEAVAKETLRKAGIYKEGGIIKADGGAVLDVELPSWFNYKQQALTRWSPELNKDKWVQTNTGFHTDANSLKSVFDANTNYTSDIAAVGNDILNYYNLGKYDSTTSLIKAYNKDANSINNFWDRDHSYGEDTGEHAPTFLRLFASRSSTDKSANLDYNLGYLTNLQNTMGSTMWHRRMDWYEKPFDLLTDLEKQNRIHAIKLSNGDYGYVYKNHDGTLGELANDEAERILNLEKAKTLSQLQYDPDTDTFYGAEIPEVTVVGNKPQTSEGSTGTVLNPEERQNKVQEQPAPVKPNDSLFTPDKVLAALNYFRARGHNAKALQDALRLIPLLYDPVWHLKNVYGNLPAKVLGLQQAGDVRYLTGQMRTSDIDKWMSHRLEGEKLAQQYILLGWQSDNETMRQMSELAWQLEKENKENRYNIAMKNRENSYQVTNEKLLAEINKNRADYESGTNFINEMRVWLDAKEKAKKEKANLLFSRQLSSYISNNPDKYIPGWNGGLKLIWDKANSGETLTLSELRVISQIRSLLAEAYYNEMYGTGKYYGYGIKQPEWLPTLKKGGKITNDMVKAIISYLKESNKNYHKDIDRSVKGLYNHIKLQKRK